MITILQGDVVEQLRTLPDQSVHCVVTSPPYWGLRDYGVDGQIGLEKTPEEYVAKMVEVFREVKRVLRDDGTLWLNLGDSYGGQCGNTHSKPNNLSNSEKQKSNCGSWQIEVNRRNEVIKPKDLCGIPWRVAFALQYPDYTCNGCGETHHSSEWGKFPNGRLICPSCELSKGHSIIPGWYLRSDIIWSKPNPMPESVTDRPTKAHEYIFLLTKQARYYYDADAVREKYLDSSIERLKQGFNMNGLNPAALATKNPAVKAQGIIEPNPAGRNRRTVWEIATQPTPEAHFATFPEALVEPCIKAGCPIGGTVLDPFGGSGTTAKVARQLKRDCILIELNPAYIKIANHKLRLNEQLGVA